jgi:hypothetical protein
MNVASARATSVLPTPVGPTKRNVPIGLVASWTPALKSAIVSTIALIASSCPTIRALSLALKEGLDLVEVNPEVSPPVCKLLDLAKYTYEEAKKASLATAALGDHDAP